MSTVTPERLHTVLRVPLCGKREPSKPLAASDWLGKVNPWASLFVGASFVFGSIVFAVIWVQRVGEPEVGARFNAPVALPSSPQEVNRPDSTESSPPSTPATLPTEIQQADANGQTLTRKKSPLAQGKSKPNRTEEIETKTPVIRTSLRTRSTESSGD